MSAGGGDKPDSGLRWIRSYALAEERDELGSVCVYEAEGPDAIRAHAEAANPPVDEIVPVAATIVVRPDPTPAEGRRGRFAPLGDGGNPAATIATQTPEKCAIIDADEGAC